MWYTFRQNNSFGNFDITEDLTLTVFVEADDAIEANCTFEYIGGYFNGIEDGIDCPCCGDRWNRTEKGRDRVLWTPSTFYEICGDKPVVICYTKKDNKKISFFKDSFPNISFLETIDLTDMIKEKSAEIQ